MDYKGKATQFKRAAEYWESQRPEYPDVASSYRLASILISELLARAEKAETERDKMREVMQPNCLLCDSMHKENGNCMEVGGFCTSVPAAHCPLIPKLFDKLKKANDRAQKAEKELQNYKIGELYDMPPMRGFYD